MGCTVLALQVALAPYSAAIPGLLLLLVYVTVGTLSYVVFLLSLWQLNGRPEHSAETAILRQIAQRLNLTK
jgi:hypothetical protein